MGWKSADEIWVYPNGIRKPAIDVALHSLKELRYLLLIAGIYSQPEAAEENVLAPAQECYHRVALLFLAGEVGEHLKAEADQLLRAIRKKAIKRLVAVSEDVV